MVPFVDSPPTTLHGISDDLHAIDKPSKWTEPPEDPMTLEKEAINSFIFS
jgi:hypothetical protein